MMRIWLQQELPPATTARAVTALGLLALALLGALYLLVPDWYFKLLSPFFFFDHPFRYPFHDLGGVLASIECWQRGVDVYSSNPCDAENRSWPYSPLVLRLAFVPTDMGWLWLQGCVLALLFLLSLRWLPPARRRGDLLWILAATFSSATVFALERANLDVLIFVLVAAAGALGLRRPFAWRAAGYLLVLVAGLIKYYPFVLFLLALRERLSRCLQLWGLAALSLVLFAWAYHPEITRALALIGNMDQGWGPFSDRFGARQLAAGIWTLLERAAAVGPGELWSAAALRGPHVQGPAWATLGLLGLAVALLLHLLPRLELKVRWRTLSASEADFLVLGAALMAGCFLAGYSNAYRAIFLLPMLPGLLALARPHAGMAAHRLLRWAPALLLYSLWAMATQHVIQYAGKCFGWGDFGSWFLAADWLLHELAWWGLLLLCLALLQRFLLDSRFWRSLLAWVSQRRAAAGQCV